MKIVGVMLARNEAWVLRASIDAALRWVDTLVLINHGSKDGTRQIADNFIPRTMLKQPQRMVVKDWNDGEHWLEMDARQMSLEVARNHGASHVAIIDADEILMHNNLGIVRDWFGMLQPGQCLDLPMIAPWKSLDVYSPHTQGVITLGFKDTPELAWRPRGEEKYHFHNRPPHGARQDRLTVSVIPGGVFHLQYASEKRIVWKHRHYLMQERVRWPMYAVKDLNAKYHWWQQPPHGTDLRAVPGEWWGDYPKHLIQLDHEPWHAQACREMWAKYGAETFAGLDLFGWSGE